jgi:hypothetical protein
MTDVGFFQQPFGINREGVTLTVLDSLPEPLITGTYATLECRIAYTSNGTTLANESLVFGLTAVKRDGSVEVINYTTFSGTGGLATWNMQVPADWQSFYFSITFSSDNPRIRSLSTNPTTTTPVFTQEQYDLMLLVNNLPLLAIVAGFIIAIIVVNVRVNAHRRARWHRDAEKVRDVLRIRHLLAIVKESGVCAVSRSYSTMNLDADLVSGFLTAVASFGKEIGNDESSHLDKDKSAKDGMTIFDYQDFKILIAEGYLVRIALILDGIPTENLRTRANDFIIQFEAEYDLTQWHGNLDTFSTVDNLIEKAFEITLAYPLVVSDRVEKKQIKSSLAKMLVNVGEASQKEKKVFYLGTLVDYARAARRRESDDQVLGEIYKLRKQNVFTFYTP